MHLLQVFGLLTLLFGFHQALIVPQELPSILSLIYSNIPPIKKGTDSRLGFGFRLGEHADFQVMLELGPQTETRKIGGVNANKREVNPEDAVHHATRTNMKTYKEAQGWLTQWSKDMKKSRKKEFANAMKSSTTSTTSTTVRTVPLIAEDSLKQLQKLYKPVNSE